MEHEKEFHGLFPQVFFLPDYPELEQVRKIIAKHIEQKCRTVKDHIHMMLQSMRHEMPAVLLLCLERFHTFLKSHENELTRWTQSNPVEKIVSDMIHTLIDTVRRLQHQTAPTELQILQWCTRCLGVIGAIDPDRIHDLHTAPSKKEEEERRKELPLIDDFSKPDTIAPYTIRFIEKVLVGAFRAAKDTKLQNRYAFTIQSLLRISNFQSEVVESSSSEKNKENVKVVVPANAIISALWRGLADSVRHTIRPFLTSKYEISYSKSQAIPSPIFAFKSSHQEWIKSWTVQLIETMHSKHAQELFQPCTPILRGSNSDVNVANWLLPQLVLVTLVEGTVDQREAVRQEFLEVIERSKGREMSVQVN